MKHRIGPDGDTLQVYDGEKHFRSEADPYRARPALATWRNRLIWEASDRYCAAFRAPGAELERQRVQWLERRQKRQQLARQADSEPWSEDAKRKYRNYLDGLTPEQLLEPGT